MMSPKSHSNYWRALAQERLATIARLRDSLRQCQKRATVRGKPNGPGHFGIAAIAWAALRDAKTRTNLSLLGVVARAINGGDRFTTPAMRRVRYDEARAVLRAI